MNVRLQYKAIIWLPINLSTSISPLWPPDGVIMAILVFFFIVGVHLFLLILGISHAIFFKIKKFHSLYSGLFRIICQVLWFRVHTYYKLGIKAKATKLLRVHSPFLIWFQRDIHWLLMRWTVKKWIFLIMSSLSIIILNLASVITPSTFIFGTTSNISFPLHWSSYLLQPPVVLLSVRADIFIQHHLVMCK